MHLVCTVVVFEHVCLCSGLSLSLVCFLVSANFLGPVAKCFARRLKCLSGASIPYLPTSHFMNMCKYTQMLPTHLSVLTPHISFLLDGRYIVMTMLLIPLSVLSVICLNPRTPVLGITRIHIDCAIWMWADVVTGRCRASCKPIALSGKNKKRSFMDHVLKHFSLTVCGLCYLTGCAEHVVRDCRNFHGQKTLHVPNAYLGRFVVHRDLLESFIAFSRGCRLTDEQEVSVIKAFADKKVLIPPQPQVMMGWVAPSAHITFCVFFSSL